MTRRLWKRQQRPKTSSNELDLRVESARADRTEAAKIRKTSETRADRLRKLEETNGFGEGFRLAFEAARQERSK